MKQFHVFFQEEQLHALKKASQKTGAPIAELIRRAVSAYFDNHKKSKPFLLDGSSLITEAELTD